MAETNAVFAQGKFVRGGRWRAEFNFGNKEAAKQLCGKLFHVEQEG